MLAIKSWRPTAGARPPVPFALILMGSAGRGECLLAPDQDNGFVLADYDDAAHTRIDAYFVPLAERFTQLLDAIGFPLCLGNVMATNPVWRKRISEWRRQIAIWLRKRTEAQLLLSDILVDFQHVWGDAALSQALRASHHAGDRREPDLHQGPVRDRGRPRRGARLVRAAQKRARQAGPSGDDQSEAARQLALGGSGAAAIAQGGVAGDFDAGPARRTAGQRRTSSRGSRQSEGRVSTSSRGWCCANRSRMSRRDARSATSCPKSA